MTKRGAPGVWIYRVLRRLGAELHVLHGEHATTAIGRFYETQSYGPQMQYTVTLGGDAPPAAEWFRPNFAGGRGRSSWGPAEQRQHAASSGVSLALSHVAREIADTVFSRITGMMKNKRGQRRARPRPTIRVGDSGHVKHRKAEAADARRTRCAARELESAQGERAAFKAGSR